MPQWGKELTAGGLGVLNGASLNTMELAANTQAKKWNTSSLAALNMLNRMKNEAPVSYAVGETVGSFAPAIATGGAASELMAINNPLLKNAAVGAVSNAAPTLIADLNSGKSLGQAAGHALQSGAVGGGFGTALTMLGSALPKAGTIEYQKLLDGGLSKGAASFMDIFARGVNPTPEAPFPTNALDSIEYGRRIGAFPVVYGTSEYRLPGATRLSPSEHLTAGRFIDDFGMELRESPHIGVEYYLPEVETKQKLDAMGTEEGSRHWNEKQFLKSIDRHLLKDGNHTIVDMKDYTDEQVKIVEAYLRRLPSTERLKIVLLKKGY